MCREECVHTVCEHVCLCLTPLRNSWGSWVQANLKTEQVLKVQRERGGGRNYMGEREKKKTGMSGAGIFKESTGG